MQSHYILSQIVTPGTDIISCYAVTLFCLFIYTTVLASSLSYAYTSVHMISLDDFEVVRNTLDSVLSVDSFQFLTGTVNSNSEVKMLLFSCE